MGMEEYKKKLRSNGYKLTPQRLEIINVFLDSPGKHLSAENVSDLLKEVGSDMGLATVYRTIQLLESLGILSSIYIGDGKVRYELYADDGMHNHHHLICNKCGEVSEFMSDELEDLEKKIKEEMKFSVIDHEVKFYGICDDCQKSSNKK